MNNSQMHTRLDVLLDKSGSPWFNVSEKDIFLNLALLEYVKETYKVFEQTERKREDLAPLARRIKVPGSTTKSIMLNVMPDFLFILNMLSIFTSSCSGETITITNYKHMDSGTASYTYPSDHPLYESSTSTMSQFLSTDTYTSAIQRSVKSVQLDDINTVFGDPFNKPSDEYPLYVMRGDVNSHGYIEIFSDNVPLAVYIDYLKKPKAIDAENNPLLSTDLPEHVHDEIVNIALRKMLENVENINRYKTQKAEIMEQSN